MSCGGGWAANARDRFTMEFTAELMIDRTVAMYKRIMTEPVPSPPPIMKRVFDALLSGTGLVLSAPVWAVAAAAIKLEDGGPVFFRQARVGQNGSLFTVLKFRSMVVHAERDHGPRQAAAGDARVTRVGTADAGDGHGRAAAARQHLQGRHELRRSARTRARARSRPAATAGSFRWRRSRATANVPRSSRD